MLFVPFGKSLSAGDCVIFSVAKRSTHPGARAKEIRPELHGEGYHYIVDKFWIVNERRGTQVVLMTRRGKIHIMEEDHPHLQRASWWQRLMYRSRFPQPRTTSEQHGMPV